MVGAEYMRGKGERCHQTIRQGLDHRGPVSQGREFQINPRCLGRSLEGFKPGSDTIQ